jgi:hypothetical protein
MFDLPFAQHQRHTRFLENHDEPRIASRLDAQKNLAAAVWTFTLPGTVLIYDGQLEGKRVRIPVQLLREPHEPVNEEVRTNYRKLLNALRKQSLRSGVWTLLAPRPAWMGNETHHKILGMAWDYNSATAPASGGAAPSAARAQTRVFVNASEDRSQCWVDIALGNLAAKEGVLTDQLSGKVFVRNGVELMMRGLYLDMEPWEAHIFDCTVRPNTGLTLE